MAKEIERWTFDNDTLFDLVRVGVKRGTCSLWHTDAEMTHVGDVSEIYNSRGETVRIQTTAVRKCRFCNVETGWAGIEGDQSLDDWRQIHWSFFTKIKPDFQETDYLELEEFAVISG